MFGKTPKIIGTFILAICALACEKAEQASVEIQNPLKRMALIEALSQEGISSETDAQGKIWYPSKMQQRVTPLVERIDRSSEKNVNLSSDAARVCLEELLMGHGTSFLVQKRANGSLVQWLSVDKETEDAFVIGAIRFGQERKGGSSTAVCQAAVVAG